MAKATDPQGFADRQLKERPHKTSSPHVTVGTYTQQANVPRQDHCHRASEECYARISLEKTPWRMVNRRSSSRHVQAPVLCAFNTFSFPLCSLNKKKLFCKATFCSFCFPFVFIMFLISSLKRNSLNLCLPTQFDAF